MTREAAIHIGRESLWKNGFCVAMEPETVQLISGNEYKKHLTAVKVAAPQWIMAFPLATPNEMRTHAIISVDDLTGVASQGHLS